MLLVAGAAGCGLFDEDVETIPYGPEESQYGELFVPDGDGPFPTVVVIHGGSWTTEVSAEATRPISRWLADHGWVAWNLEYARVGEQLGGYPGTLEDVAVGIDHLQQLAEEEDRPIDLDRVLVLGHSAGGQLALWAAARPGIAPGQPGAQPAVVPVGAVSLAGVTDLVAATNVQVLAQATEDLLGGSPEQVPERYDLASPIARVPLGVPQIVGWGEEDETVPAFMATAYADAASGAGDQVQRLEVPDTNHFSWLDPDSTAWQELSRQLEGLLPAPAS